MRIIEIEREIQATKVRLKELFKLRFESSERYLIGTGNHLHVLIKKYTGQSYNEKCGCESMVRQMNAWGPEGCREHLDEIVAKMTAEAKKRGWKTGLLASVPIASKLGMRAMVLHAIRLAERESAS